LMKIREKTIIYRLVGDFRNDARVDQFQIYLMENS